MPPGVPGHILITTRRSGFGSLGAVLDLDVISLPDAVRLLQTRVPGLEQASGRRSLPSWDGCHWPWSRLPPTLTVPGCRGASTWTCSQPGRGTVLARPGRVARRDDRPLWNVSLERVAAEDPAAILLLEICSYLAPEPVPLDLFTAHTDLLPSPLSAAAADPLKFTDTIAVLADYSLATHIRRAAATSSRTGRHPSAGGTAAAEPTRSAYGE